MDDDDGFSGGKPLPTPPKCYCHCFSCCIEAICGNCVCVNHPFVVAFLIFLTFLGFTCRNALVLLLIPVAALFLACMRVLPKSPCCHMCVVCPCCAVGDAMCEDIIEKWYLLGHKNAYIDVCIRATDFCTGAHRAWMFMKERGLPVRDYMGVCVVLTTVGIIGMAAFTGLVTFLIVDNVDIFADETSEWYISDAAPVCIMAAALGGQVAYSFMHLFDHASDTILYCYAWNKKKNRKNVEPYIPEELKWIVGPFLMRRKQDLDDDFDDDVWGRFEPNMYLRKYMPVKRTKRRNRTGFFYEKKGNITGGGEMYTKRY
eukprot:gnl/TRDRNA2_/TRDRNA2_94287_c1_seq1.p1 gnl/TRDRNA2_/TRDRNA2_94287_c1~~gnl/TRDRNA2_/TRDRNA2_94287_c1_seq1.p1  ORF type:complete len:350 (-),score=82.09 gnl/TRDRNA2_/TRDRNA2_94287_c1_seq1:200-1144(-)